MKKLIVLPVLLALCSLSFAADIVIPASQIEKGKGFFDFFYTHATRKINLNVDSLQQITVNNHSYFSNVSNNLECDSNSDSLNVKVIFNPHDTLYYWIKAGAGHYAIDIPSTTVKNSLSGRDPGYIFGLGVRSVLFPDTIVTPAFGFEAGVNYSFYNLDSYKSGSNATELISDRLSLTELQIALLMSKRYKKFEPYGGVRVSRVYTTLKDNNSTASVSGTKDDASIFVGTKVNVYSKDALLIECSFIGESSLSIAWNIAF